MELRELGEFPFIRSISMNTVMDPSSITVGIGDDCAVYPCREGMEQVLTTDMMVEGIHFSPSTTRPFDIGYRLATANVSDIAAMGAVPRHITISVAAPRTTDVSYLHGIYDGVKALCREYKLNIIGGDTVSTKGPIVLSITAVGEIPAGQAVLRRGAVPGDWIGVTGRIGSSAVGLDVLHAGEEDYTFSKMAHQRPQPQVELGILLRESGATSLNDISDGLASELNEIAEASQVKLTIEADLIPLHKETLRWSEARSLDPIDFALYGGEDFQLVFTISDEGRQKLERDKRFTFIGRADKGKPGVVMIDREGRLQTLQTRGYDHFAK